MSTPSKNQTRTPAERAKNARRAALGAFAGTSIEWYDFYVYGTAAALVFPELFFPSEDPLVSAVASMASFGVGFVLRPVGGVIFGHVGDRVGRKKSLVITLVMMGAGTFAIGLLPTYESIGIASPILLLVFRSIQGLSVGGEWGGAVLMAGETASQKRKVLAGVDGPARRTRRLPVVELHLQTVQR